jgi:hypothetical protein
VTTQVIYTRVPDAVKEAADAYANERGAKLSSAVVELLEKGLTAVGDEESISALEARVALLGSENSQLQAELMTAHTELSAVKTLAQRAVQVVGSCPKCTKPISGYDLLAVGQCAQCGQALTNLLAPDGPSTGLDQREFLILVGALGAVVGLALLAAKG